MNPVINENYEELFLTRTPLLDVRAPCEFQQGAFPGAINLPLLDDRERHAVGLCYKERGPQAAVALGHELVSGELRDTRIQSWVDWLTASGPARTPMPLKERVCRRSSTPIFR